MMIKRIFDVNSEQVEAIEVLRNYIRTDEYKTIVRDGIDRENELFGKIESSGTLSFNQRFQKYE